jgi:type I restriction enzyme S subunit
MNYWPTKKLGEICEENIKSPFKVENATNSGEYPFFTSGDNILTHDEYLVDGENIFLATGGYANVKYYNGKASYSTDTWSLKVKNGLAKFVFYQILARLKYIDEVLFRGSGLRHLQKKEFLKLEILLPPLPIQQKIVKILDTIQEAIDIHDNIIEKTKELKKSMMAELFKYGAPSFRKERKLKKTEIGEIPENWEVVRLGEVTSQIIDTPHKIPPKTSFGIPFISVNYMLNFPDTNFYIDKAKEGLEYVDLNEAREFLKRFIPEKNDILFSKWGTPGVAKLINTSEKFLGSCSLALIKPLTLKVNPFYLVYLLNSPVVRKQVDLLSPTSTRTEIHIGHIKNLKIPLPSLPEQQEISEILQIIDQKIEIEKKKKELYQELFKTMLHKIMNQEIDINLLDY